MAVDFYTKSGSKSQTKVSLVKDIFSQDIKNHELLKLSYLRHLNNKRDNLAVTKTRGKVRGGGKKPWRQKGTGQARVGSSRTPVWRGGGIIFGPTGNENYSLSINKKAKRKAIKQALSLANQDSKLAIIDSIDLKEPKTKTFNLLLNKLNANKKCLIVVDKVEDNLRLSSNNLVNVKVITAKYLSVFDILNNDRIIVTKAALEIINKWLVESVKS